MGEQTFQEMCEIIAEANHRRPFLRFVDDGSLPTAEEIFHYSPTGELAKLFDWYEMAECVLKTGEFPDWAQLTNTPHLV